MIRVKIGLDQSGCLRELKVEGHALQIAGKSVVCAAATVLIRTMARSVEDHPAITVLGEATLPGTLELRLSDYAVETKEWLKGMTDFFLRGLADLEDEYPQECRIIRYKT